MDSESIRLKLYAFGYLPYFITYNSSFRVWATYVHPYWIHNAQDEERAVYVCLNPFDVIAVELARHLFFGALTILGDVPEVREDIK